MTTYHKSTRLTKLVASENMYTVGQWINMYFVDFYFYPGMVVIYD